MKYLWVGPSRVIPDHGVAETGKEIELPESLGDSFVRQKLAEAVKPKRKKEED